MSTCTDEQTASERAAAQTASGTSVTSGDAMETDTARVLSESRIARKKASEAVEAEASEKNEGGDVVDAGQDEEEDKEGRTGVEGGEGREGGEGGKDAEMNENGADGEVKEVKSVEEDINEEIEEAIMTYAWVDLADPDLTFVFGDMNPRTVNPVEVTKLIGSFLANQVRRWSKEYVIPVGFTREALKEEMFVKTLTPRMKLPSLKAMAIGRLTEVRPFGGQHRHAAITKLAEDSGKWLAEEVKRGRHEQLKNAVSSLSAEIGKDDVDALDGEGMKRALVQRRLDLEEYEREVKSRKEIIEQGAKWMVVVYDYGE